MPFVSEYRITDAIEILLLTVAIYAILRFIRSTRGVGVLRGLFTVAISATVLLGILDRLAPGGMDVIRYILSIVTPFFALIVVVLFQQELRHGISRFGQAEIFRRLRGGAPASDEIHQIAAAAKRLANQRIGALIALEREVSLQPFSEGAVALDLPVTSVLLETIFFPGSPLHDGGVVVRGKAIVAAAAIFPLSSNPQLPARLGTRHRAGIGLSEETDAIGLIVSEETGEISLAKGGKLEQAVPQDQLERRLEDLLRSAGTAAQARIAS